ncbi:alkene reductase [Erythrobacter alti]|uniref:alkene reductase n=1 Tax=Erythrobacter alti TaxID=1896145 RepID=UPI0030F3F872
MPEVLFEPTKLGSLALRNRIVMAPMTRDRAGPGDVPSDIMVEYYRQRSGAGMIVTEGTQPSLEGKGYWRTPGIHSDAQIEGWRRVADAVHSEGGTITMQIMHCGRVVVADNRGFEADVVAPSAIACPAKVPGPDGVPQTPQMPRALKASELTALAQEFGDAARNARAAGIDGVELHCASGYLINQFLNPVSNLREDEFGGSPENRARFPIMVLKAMAGSIGADRVGFRISPGNKYNGMDVSNPWETFTPFLREANKLGLAYLHVVDMGEDCPDTLAMCRESFSGPIIANNGFNAERAEHVLAHGKAQAVSFGLKFIANPDLPYRFRNDAELAKPDFDKIYTGEAAGYCDYPALA